MNSLFSLRDLQDKIIAGKQAETPDHTEKAAHQLSVMERMKTSAKKPLTEATEEPANRAAHVPFIWS